MSAKKVVLFITFFISLASVSAEFVVNTVDDLIDFNPGDGICEATALSGDCSLRAAIIETNALAGNNRIMLPEGNYILTITGEDDGAMFGDLDIISGELTITGAGMNDSVIDGNGLDRIFHISTTTVTFNDLTLQNGGNESTTVNGGALLAIGDVSTPLVFNSVRFDNNRANAGGGILVTGLAAMEIPVIISNSIFNNNSTTSLFATNPFGTAIYCRLCDLKVNSTTISNSHFNGKALRVENSSLEMLNSTISNNDTGGIRSTNSNVSIKFSTIVENGAQNLSFFSFDDSHAFEVGQSVMQSTTSSNCQFGDLPTSIGYNVLSDDSCSFMAVGDVQNLDALLGELTNNGGDTQTHKPQVTSPLINQVPLASCIVHSGTALLLDQREAQRPYDFLCDIGALEVNTDIIFVNGFE